MFSDFLVKTLEQCRLGTLPSYFSGRGAREGDLDSQMLEKIHDTIVEHKGKPAGIAFLDMVEAIEVLSATDFLITLEALDRNNFVWDAALVSTKKGNYADSFDTAVATAAERMCGSGRQDDTRNIRGPFLRSHGRNPKGGQYSEYYDAYDGEGRLIRHWAPPGGSWSGYR